MAAVTAEFLSENCIGSHVGKKKSFLATVADFTPDRPYQIFLSGPLSATVKADPADVAAAASVISEQGLRIFVHSQYIVNLSGPKNVAALQATLQIAANLGALGVVVHVGKAVGQTHSAATETMKKSILECLPFATEACPLLLETPAGQGTELLTTWAGFTEFVTRFEDNRLGICIDTCHVFASGIAPVEYIKKTLETCPGRLRLIHYNDSQGDCGCRVDRHALAGTGSIGLTVMEEIAMLCIENDLPMVIE